MPHACARRGHYHRHIYIPRRTTANTEAITPAVTTTMSPGQAGATKKTTPRKLMSGLTSQKTARHRLWNGVPHARWGIPPGAHQELGPYIAKAGQKRAGAWLYAASRRLIPKSAYLPEGRFFEAMPRFQKARWYLLAQLLSAAGWAKGRARSQIDVSWEGLDRPAAARHG